MLTVLRSAHFGHATSQRAPIVNAGRQRHCDQRNFNAELNILRGRSSHYLSIDSTGSLKIVCIVFQLAVSSPICGHTDARLVIGDTAPACSARRARSRLLSYSRSSKICRCNCTQDFGGPAKFTATEGSEGRMVCVPVVDPSCRWQASQVACAPPSHRLYEPRVVVTGTHLHTFMDP